MHKRSGAIGVLLFLAQWATAQAEDFDTAMMRSTVKLRHDKSTATAFVLRQPRTADRGGPRSILITAKHVFEKTIGDETSLVYRVREAEGVYKKESMSLSIRKDGQALWTQHPSEDVAAVVVSLPEKADLTEISTEVLASDDQLRRQNVHPGQSVALLGYPHRTEANDAGVPILRTGAIASYPLIPSSVNRTFLLNANTFEGDSGGPIYLTGSGSGNERETGVILGLMHGQRFLDEEMVMIYGTSKVRHRLGLGIVVQAAFIRETIERLP